MDKRPNFILYLLLLHLLLLGLYCTVALIGLSISKIEIVETPATVYAERNRHLAIAKTVLRDRKAILQATYFSVTCVIRTLLALMPY